MTAFANRKHAIRDSYSASLLEEAKSKLNDCLINSPFGDCSWTPAPDPLFVDEPSTCRIQFWLERIRSCSSSGASSIRKLARICDLAAVWFSNTMSCLLSSMVHFDSRPYLFVFWITVRRGWLVSTSIVCDWLVRGWVEFQPREVTWPDFHCVPELIGEHSIDESLVSRSCVFRLNGMTL